MAVPKDFFVTATELVALVAVHGQSPFSMKSRAIPNISAWPVIFLAMTEARKRRPPFGAVVSVLQQYCSD
jgi:hypothetical protein